MGRNPLPFVVAIAALVFLAAAGGKPKAKTVDAPAAVTPAVSPAVASAIELMDFGGDWCGPCRETKPAVKQLESEGTKVHRIDPNEDQAAADKWHVHDCPTFIAVRDGKEVGRYVGKCSIDTLRTLVAKASDKSKASQSPEVVATPKPTPRADAGSVRGPDGWRLRLFYPLGDAHGEQLKAQISSMKAICLKYGFDATTTEVGGELNHNWRKQINANEVTLVLVHPDDRIIYKESGNIPSDPIVLRETLRKAARESWGTK